MEPLTVTSRVNIPRHVLTWEFSVTFGDTVRHQSLTPEHHTGGDQRFLILNQINWGWEFWYLWTKWQLKLFDLLADSGLHHTPVTDIRHGWSGVVFVRASLMIYDFVGKLQHKTNTNMESYWFIVLAVACLHWQRIKINDYSEPDIFVNVTDMQH